MTKPTTMRIRRIEMALTLAELGLLVGLDETSLSRVERGRRTIDTARASAIAKVLKAELETLFTENDGRFVVLPTQLAATA